jgi:hypothetical protein
MQQCSSSQQRLLKVPPQRTGAIGWVINPRVLPADRNTWLLTEFPC